MNQLHIVPFPYGAESNGFIAALSSAMLPCLGITAETPYWCSPKDSYCIHCSDCDPLQKHQEMLYHTLLTASGLAFTFDYPEDDSVPCHTMPGISTGWRWEDPFVSTLMDFAGLRWQRCRCQPVTGLYHPICRAIDNGCTALAANYRHWDPDADPNAWEHCWDVIYGYTDDGLCVMHHGGDCAVVTDGTYDDCIIITGRSQRQQSFRDVLERICAILTDPSHDVLERELYAELSAVTPEAAVGLAHKLMAINGVPIETRWHAAEAFVSRDNLLSALIGDTPCADRLRQLFFSRYIADNSNETHGTGWKIWGALEFGPGTGYQLSQRSFELLQQPEVQAELQRLFRIVFDNDRAVAAELQAVLRTL